MFYDNDEKQIYERTVVADILSDLICQREVSQVIAQDAVERFLIFEIEHLSLVILTQPITVCSAEHIFR